MAHFAICPALEEQAGTIAALRRQVWRETYRNIYPPQMLDGFDLAEHTRRDAARIRDPRYEVFLLTEEGTAVGYLILGPRPRLVCSLYLVRAAQGRGYGRRVFDFLRVRWAGEAGFTCTCHPDNRRALGFYRKMGGQILDQDLTNEESWQNSVTLVFPVELPEAEAAILNNP